MMIRILIPNADTYGLMIIAILSLGSFNIARHIHVRWLSSYCSLITSNAIIKTILTLIGLVIIPLRQLFQPNLMKEFLSILIGIIFGLCVIMIEIYMIRKMNRQCIINKEIKSPNENYFLRNANINQTLKLASTKSITAKGLNYVRKNSNDFSVPPNILNYSLSAVIIIAIAEEFLFRGYLFSIASFFSTSWIYISIILISIIFFAFSHVSQSWNEFMRKLPLSIFSSIGFLLTNSLFSAISTHVCLNIYAFLQLQKLAKDKI